MNCRTYTVRLALIVRDYDELISYFVRQLDFNLVKDSVLLGDNRRDLSQRQRRDA